MSYTIDKASKVHEDQVAAVETLQSMLIKTTDVFTGLRSKAPKAPEKLTDAVTKAAAPLIKLVGTPSEVQSYAVASSRDWLKVQHKFQTALQDAVFPLDVTVEVPAPSASKKRKKS